MAIAETLRLIRPEGLPDWQIVERNLGQLSERNQRRIRNLYWKQVEPLMSELSSSGQVGYWKSKILANAGEPGIRAQYIRKAPGFLNEAAETIRSFAPVDPTAAQPTTVLDPALKVLGILGGGSAAVPKSKLLEYVKKLFADPDIAIRKAAHAARVPKPSVVTTPKGTKYEAAKRSLSEQEAVSDAFKNRDLRIAAEQQANEQAEAKQTLDAVLGRRNLMPSQTNAPYSEQIQRNVEQAAMQQLRDRVRAYAAAQQPLIRQNIAGHAQQATTYSSQVPSTTSQTLNAAKQILTGTQMPPNIGSSRTLREAAKLIAGQKPQVFTAEEIAGIIRNLAKAKSEQTPLGRLLEGMPRGTVIGNR